MSEPCAVCGAPAACVRDDDVPHCQACRDDDDTGLVWWAASAGACNCRAVCGDVDDEQGTCKGLRRAPAVPLVEIVLVHRDEARRPRTEFDPRVDYPERSRDDGY